MMFEVLQQILPLFVRLVLLELFLLVISQWEEF
ncbi:unnamed protein product [Brugia timori]|uniref:NADH dehydrogenase subunit 1 n=1 Tax=Brugia timori TaxID=42155 RepID=A0A0R3QFP9_9BILA|nr:unnamed protein product [Brugia timori]